MFNRKLREVNLCFIKIPNSAKLFDVLFDLLLGVLLVILTGLGLALASSGKFDLHLNMFN